MKEKKGGSAKFLDEHVYYSFPTTLNRSWTTTSPVLCVFCCGDVSPSSEQVYKKLESFKFQDKYLQLDWYLSFRTRISSLFLRRK